jgi:hypothetical protein
MRLMKRMLTTLTFGAVAAAALWSGNTSTVAQVRRAETGFAVKHDISAPLSSLVQRTRAGSGAEKEVPIKVPPRLPGRPKPADAGPDRVRQQGPGTGTTPPPLLSFEGISDDDNSRLLGFRVVPPDTQGDVGRNHYVQWVNLLIAVYDKTSGRRVFGPAPGNSVWNGFGGICEETNDGDPIVLYDHLADRWMISQFAIGDDGHQCVAVSTTSDPTGSYFRYDFLITRGGLNDYPKFGVWPDGYYMTVNEFTPGFAGASVVAFEREQMLTGAPAQFVKIGPLPCAAECYFSLQPSDLDGRPSRPGTPNTIVMAWDDESFGTGKGPDGYRLFDFAVNWSDPRASTLSGPTHVAAPEFDSNLCNFNLGCIPQKGGEPLDALAGFTMYRAQYRDFGAYSSLVLNHTVDATGRSLAGVRWVELRKARGGWSVFQTGTYAPDDGSHRWMGSAAMDQAGNIALGFSVSAHDMFASIRYITRQADDPPGQMSGEEVSLVEGSGAQVGSFKRWGDYSTMSVDPFDGCTFWYTQEYYANSGFFDFKTRIGSFRVPGC